MSVGGERVSCFWRERKGKERILPTPPDQGRKKRAPGENLIPRFGNLSRESVIEGEDRYEEDVPKMRKVGWKRGVEKTHQGKG